MWYIGMVGIREGVCKRWLFWIGDFKILFISGGIFGIIINVFLGGRVFGVLL